MNIVNFLKKSIDGKLTPEQQEEFLQSKENISAEELATTVRFLRKQMPQQFHFPNAIDVCGTGGSGLTRINTSTISTFILAALGIKMAKHGNRAASGRFGSFDLIESLGIEIENVDTQSLYNIENLVFLFAQKFHPIMRHFGEARKRIGKPTFFNLLGPLLNPCNVRKQIIGTGFKDKMELIAQTCKLLGREKVFVVCGEDGLDEVTLTGKTYVVELNNGKIKKYTITPKDFGISKCKFEQIRGGSAKANTKIATDILNGKQSKRHTDLVLVNTALGLKLTGTVKTLKHGYKLAKTTLEKGLALEKFENYKTLSHTPSILLEIVENKKKEVAKMELNKKATPSKRDFMAALQTKNLSLIAEIKKQSPSNKTTVSEFSPKEIAKTYEQSGVDAISVLCDQKYFGGSMKDLQTVAENTTITPLLCKEFIIDVKQIYEARKHGADAILLIAAILTTGKIRELLKLAKSLKMAVICEVHTSQELEKVLKTPAKIIGINNRNLHTFTTDLKTTKQLITHIPKDKIVISESGIHTAADIKSLPKRTNAILVGTSIMRSKDIRKKIAELHPRPNTKLKVCGIRTIAAAKSADKLGVDFIGLNFVPTSKRKITLQEAIKIRKTIKHSKIVGIFQNQPVEEVNAITKTLDLDFIQLSGDESTSYIKHCKKPVIKNITLKSKNDIATTKKYAQHVAFILFDGQKPGSGKSATPSLLKQLPYASFIAGGITTANIKQIAKLHPLGIDVASGIETNGEVDTKKIKSIHNQIKSC